MMHVMSHLALDGRATQVTPPVGRRYMPVEGGDALHPAGPRNDNAKTCLSIDFDKSVGFRSRSRHSLETKPTRTLNNQNKPRKNKVKIQNYYDNNSSPDSEPAGPAARFKHMRMMRDQAFRAANAKPLKKSRERAPAAVTKTEVVLEQPPPQELKVEKVNEVPQTEKVAQKPPEILKCQEVDKIAIQMNFVDQNQVAQLQSSKLNPRL